MKSYKLLDEEKALENEIENLKPISRKKKENVEKIVQQAKKNFLSYLKQAGESGNL